MSLQPEHPEKQQQLRVSQEGVKHHSRGGLVQR